MTAILLFHDHFDPQQLDKVQTEMQTLGAPTIRCIWSEMWGLWLAVEGCHRLRAAQALGLTPVIKDVSNQKTVSIQCDGEITRRNVKSLLDEIQSDPPSTVLDF